LDNNVRSLVEEEIDNILKSPKETEEDARFVLTLQGIEPNLETVLSSITGMILGRVMQVYRLIYKRKMTPDELIELVELLKRRAFELRQAFISTRIEK